MNRRLFYCAVLAACGTPQAPRPQVPRAADACKRAQVYERNELVLHQGLFSQRFARGDGEYGLANLDDVVSAYPKSKQLLDEAKTRAAVVLGMAVVGGGVAGFAFGDNTTTPAAKQWSRNETITAYGVAGGLLVTSLLTALLWPNPMNRVVPTYNVELRADIAPNACTGQS